MRIAGRPSAARLGAREHEAVARLAGAYAPADREGRLPHSIDELRGRRIERIVARERLTAKRVANDREMAFEDRSALPAVEAEGGERRRRSAGADSQFEAAARDEIEHRGILGDPDGIFERQRHDLGAEANTRGLRRCDVRQKDEGPREAAFSSSRK